MFEQLKRRTLEILAEKAANYPFDEEPTEEEAAEEAEQYDLPEGMAKLGTADGRVMGALQLMLDQQEEGEVADFALLGNPQWDERLAQLQRCKRKLQEMADKRDKCNQVFFGIWKNVEKFKKKMKKIYSKNDEIGN